jgi:hypothetical protein
MTDTFASESNLPSGVPPETSRQAGDVTGTLAELERKLRELERELTSIGRRRAPDDTASAASDAPPGEGVPALGGAASAVGDAARAPGDEAPTRNEPAPGAALSQPGGRLVDEAVEPAPAETLERVRPSETQLASLAELRRFRDRLERFARELAAEYDALLGRVMTGLSSAPAPAAPPPPPAPSTPLTPAPEVVAAESRENALFEGRVELGVGPFYDIGSLGAFEQRLANLPGVSEASVRRFEASHAVVDVRLAAPVALVRELRRAVQSDFSVREVASGRILLTFDDA